MSNLTVLDNKTSLRAIPENKLNEIMAGPFLEWICKLLNIKANKMDGLDMALPAIKQHCWSMGFDEVKTMFELYVDCKLDLEPIPNYIDRILIGKIYEAYKQYKKSYGTSINDETKKVDPEKYKEEQDFLYCVQAFDFFEQNDNLPDQSVWLYEFLVDVKQIIEVTKEGKINIFNIQLEKHKKREVAVIKSKLFVVEQYFARLLAKGQHIKDFI